MNGRMVQWSDLSLVLTSEQVAAVLQLKRRTVTNMLDRGELQGIRVGKSWRVSRAALMQFVGDDGRSDVEAEVKAEAPVATLQAESTRPAPEMQAQTAAEAMIGEPRWEYAGIFNLIGLGAGGAPDMSSDKYKYFTEALG